jgi:hypothetical protein
MEWWLGVMPVEAGADAEAISYRNSSRALPGAGKLNSAAAAVTADLVMLIRPRKSRI